MLTNTGDAGSLQVTGVAGAAIPGQPGSCGRQERRRLHGRHPDRDDRVGDHPDQHPGAELLADVGLPAKADGLSATDVAGLTVDNSYFNINGNAADEDNIDLGGSTNGSPQGWTGTATISNSYLNLGFENNIAAGNTSGTAALVVSNTWAAIAGNGEPVGVSEDGLQVRALGTAHMAVDVTGSTFYNNGGDRIQVVASDGATLDHVTVTGSQFGGATTKAARGIVISARVLYVDGVGDLHRVGQHAQRHQRRRGHRYGDRHVAGAHDSRARSPTTPSGLRRRPSPAR